MEAPGSDASASRRLRPMSHRDGEERPFDTAVRRGSAPEAAPEPKSGPRSEPRSESDPGPGLAPGLGLGRYLPALVGLVVFVAAILVLRRALADTSPAEIVAGFRSIPASTLAAAAAIGVASYLVQTLYDLVGLRHIGSALRWRTIAPHAFCAMAVGHNVGVSAISGGAVRYRAYTALGLPGARVAAIMACYPIAYALGAATLLGLTLALAPGTAPHGERLGEPALRAVGVALCAAPLAWLLLARRAGRPFALGRLRLEPPAPRLAAAQVAIGTADVLVTAAMPWLLLSTQADVGFAPFLGAYVVAVTLGAASGVPGGLGVVEGAFVALLPGVAPAALVGALLAWRVLYFLAPLALALVVLSAQLVAGRRRARRRASESSHRIIGKGGPPAPSS